jgi:serine protease Do
MSFLELNRMAAWVVGLVMVPAGMLFGQQAKAEKSLAEQPNADTHQRVEFLRGGNLYQRHVLVGNNDGVWSLAAATYGNQLGVEIGDVDAALRSQLGIDVGLGVLVTGVSPESEAAKALLGQYDVILEVDDQAITGTKQFNELAGKLQGTTAKFHILRKGKREAISVTLPKAPVYELRGNADADLLSTELPALSGTLFAAAERQYRIGVTLAEADEVLRSQLRLAEGEGLVVTDVVADSPAAKAGIQRHDVLTKMDGKRLSTVEAANTQIQEIKERAVSIALQRAGSEVVLSVTPRLTEDTHLKVGLSQALVDMCLGKVLIYRHNADNYADLDDVVGLTVLHADPAPGQSVASQLAALKKQLADLQKSMAALEAAIQSESANKPQPPAESK